MNTSKKFRQQFACQLLSQGLFLLSLSTALSSVIAAGNEQQAFHAGEDGKTYSAQDMGVLETLDRSAEEGDIAHKIHPDLARYLGACPRTNIQVSRLF